MSCEKLSRRRHALEKSVAEEIASVSSESASASQFTNVHFSETIASMTLSSALSDSREGVGTGMPLIAWAACAPERRPKTHAAPFVDPEKGVATPEEALDGARAILIERFAENPELVGAPRIAEREHRLRVADLPELVERAHPSRHALGR